MFGSNLDNVCRKLEKNKSLKNMEVNEYLKFLCWLNTSETRRYFMISENESKYHLRCQLVQTLKEIDYRRKNNNWTSRTVAAFIQEAIECLLSGTSDEEQEISRRYNVDINKFSSMVSFFMGLKRTTYSLNQFFTDYDYTIWKYRNPKTFKKALELETISKQELNILEELNIIIYDKKNNTYIMPQN